MPTAIQPDGRPLIEQLLERYAQRIEAGDTPDLEAARQTLTHPAFALKLTRRPDADEDYRTIEELRGKLAALEAEPLDRLHDRDGELDSEIEKLDAQLGALERKRAKLAGERNAISTAIYRHRQFSESIHTNFRLHPFLHFLPAVASRLAKLGVPIPPKPNF